MYFSWSIEATDILKKYILSVFAFLLPNGPQV